jgi:hypothetical protein
MKGAFFAFHIILIIFSSYARLNAQDSLTFRGQLSGYTHWNNTGELSWWSGAHYLPQINYRHSFPDGTLFDTELTANLYGNLGVDPFTDITADGRVRPYRLWIRYSGSQFELRAGLQKINFGSATLLRPLMWFDQVDPRDPLKLTDGVWGILGRYYFLNNANIWVWGLYGNERRKGWELFAGSPTRPEYGGRIQLPVPHGETALSYHHRTISNASLPDSLATGNDIPEHRLGFDTRFDLTIGCWLEASWSATGRDLGIYTNQEVINAGIDYTFAVGNGITALFEQIVASNDRNAFSFDNTVTFSLLSLSYPLGIFDNISAIIYYDWTNNRTYSFLNWQRQLDRLTLYVMGYVNPRSYYIPAQQTGETTYAGTGIQLMLVFNY